MLNHQQKMGIVAELERAGVLENVAISSFKATCPFCFTHGAFSISLHSRNYGAAYSCMICGELGPLGQLEMNIKDASRPKDLKIRTNRQLKVKAVTK